MAHYRVYFLDGASHINEAAALDCENDEEAIKKATGISYSHVIEVWQEARLVKRIEPEPTFGRITERPSPT
jgi:hypothetical protein